MANSKSLVVERSISFTINPLVKRQIVDSQFSYFDGTWEELAYMVSQNFFEARRGYKNGIKLVPVPANNFFSNVIKVTAETNLFSEFIRHSKGEEPYLKTMAICEKLPAKLVEVVIYSHKLLKENGDNSSNADWEIVSVNASSSKYAEPMTPISMAKNCLYSDNGEKFFSASAMVESILFWSQHAMCGQNKENGNVLIPAENFFPWGVKLVENCQLNTSFTSFQGGSPCIKVSAGEENDLSQLPVGIPLHPVSIARDFFDERKFLAKQLAESILFWSKHTPN